MSNSKQRSASTSLTFSSRVEKGKHEIGTSAMIGFGMLQHNALAFYDRNLIRNNPMVISELTAKQRRCELR